MGLFILGCITLFLLCLVYYDQREERAKRKREKTVFKNDLKEFHLRRKIEQSENVVEFKKTTKIKKKNKLH